MNVDARTVEGRKVAPTRKLPDGTLTKSHVTYLRAWRRLTYAMEQALGWTTFAFDPDVSFVVGSELGAGQVRLTVEAIEDVLTAIRDRDYQIEHLRAELEEERAKGAALTREVLELRNASAWLSSDGTPTEVPE